ncbi:MAG: hypothetical protein ACK5V0_03895 [Alphaproteobacteria bacterium]
MAGSTAPYRPKLQAAPQLSPIHQRSHGRRPLHGLRAIPTIHTLGRRNARVAAAFSVTASARTVSCWTRRRAAPDGGISARSGPTYSSR